VTVLSGMSESDTTKASGDEPVFPSRAVAFPTEALHSNRRSWRWFLSPQPFPGFTAVVVVDVAVVVEVEVEAEVDVVVETVEVDVVVDPDVVLVVVEVVEQPYWYWYGDPQYS
jgi:hypothetical protein